MVTLTSEEPSLPCKVKVANLCEAVTGNIHPRFKVTNLCEAGTGNIYQEPRFPHKVEVANLCETVTENIYPNLRWQTCVKQGQETSTPIKVGPC